MESRIAPPIGKEFLADPLRHKLARSRDRMMIDFIVCGANPSEEIYVVNWEDVTCEKCCKKKKK